MRLKPDRIIIGELRGGEALALLKAWVTGNPSSFTTVNARSGREALAAARRAGAGSRRAPATAADSRDRSSARADRTDAARPASDRDGNR